MSAELVSPELALVCPNLRSRAIAALPPQQPWLPKRLHANGEPLRPAPPADQTERTVRADVSRMAAAYVLARASDLLAIMAAIALLVLVFAAAAGVVRG